MRLVVEKRCGVMEGGLEAVITSVSHAPPSGAIPVVVRAPVMLLIANTPTDDPLPPDMENITSAFSLMSASVTSY